MATTVRKEVVQVKKKRKLHRLGRVRLPAKPGFKKGSWERLPSPPQPSPQPLSRSGSRVSPTPPLSPPPRKSASSPSSSARLPRTPPPTPASSVSLPKRTSFSTLLKSGTQRISRLSLPRISAPRQASGSKSGAKNAAVIDAILKRPLACNNTPFDVRVNPPCFQEHLKKVTGDIFAKKQALVAAGKTSCDTAELNAHQAGIFEFAKSLFVHGAENMKSRGMICFHAVGSGKTALCLAIMIAAKLAERKNPNVKYRIVLASTPSNNRGNTPAVYRKNLKTFFPQYEFLFPNGIDGGMFKSYTETGWYKNVPTSRERLILLADECQNIIKPAKEVQAYAANLSKMRAWLMRADVKKWSYYFGMSGTPARSVNEWIEQLNLAVRPGKEFTTADAAHPERFRGLVSYADPKGDRSMYATLKDNRPINVLVPMDPKSYGFFLIAASKTGAIKPFDEKKAFDFLKGPLEKSAVLSKTEVGNAFDGEKDRAFTYGARTLFVMPKILKAVEAATSMPGKQMIFAANPTIAKAVEAVLLQKYDYKRVRTRDVPAPVGKLARQAARKRQLQSLRKLDPKMPLRELQMKLKSAPQPPADAYPALSTPKRRYISYGTGVRYGPSETITPEHLEGFRNLFSHEKNLRGEYVKIVVATQGYYTGTSLTELRGVHIVQPLPTFADDIQAVGRALRGCGHARLKPAEREAAVYRYFSTPPAGQFNVQAFVEATGKKKLNLSALESTVRKLKSMAGGGNFADANSVVYEDAKVRAKELVTFENKIKAVAVDCDVLKKGFHSTENFVCAPLKNGATTSPSARGVSGSKSRSARRTVSMTPAKVSGGGGGLSGRRSRSPPRSNLRTYGAPNVIAYGKRNASPTSRTSSASSVRGSYRSMSQARRSRSARSKPSGQRNIQTFRATSQPKSLRPVQQTRPRLSSWRKTSLTPVTPIPKSKSREKQRARSELPPPRRRAVSMTQQRRAGSL